MAERSFPVRFYRRLSTQLALVLGGMVVLSVGLFGLFAYELAHQSLEQELGRRLKTVAALAAGEVDPLALAGMVPGGAATRAMETRLKKIHERADLDRLMEQEHPTTLLWDPADPRSE